jgi:hypothetical protein
MTIPDNTRSPEPCTTWSRRLRHYSVNLEPDRHAPCHPGRTGRTLCGEGAYDEERRQYELSKWSDRRVVVADLPPCKKCARKAVA